jgi:molecular chaperone DnaK
VSRFACGIDLGTTNSAAAWLAPGALAPELALSPEGERLTPSLIYIASTGDVVVGAAARRAASQDPLALVEHWKRELADPQWSRTIRGKTYSPVLLSSFLLRRLLGDVERATGEAVKEAVVSVPAYFGELERGATVDAARIAGLDRVHTVNEPTAAALSYGLDPEGRTDRPRRAVVYDLGGGTFDVTVVELAKNRVRVLSTAGEPRLGGKDFDDELLNLVAEQAVEERGVDPREDDRTFSELRRRVERAKHELSLANEATIQVPLPPGRETIPVKVTREQFESRTRGLLEQTETQVAVALEKAKLGWKDVDAVLPTGGATRMPAVRELLRRVSGKQPLQALDPDEAVARGAAIYARLLARGGKLTVDGGPQRDGDVAGLLPAADSGSDTVEDDGGDDGELPLLPGEGRVPEVEDVLTHALGVLCVKKSGWKNVVVIPDQTRVPVSRTKRFKTVRPDQTAVLVKVLEGSDPDPEGCTLIGNLVVAGLPKGRAAGQRVEVVYTIAEDGRLLVSARDLATGRQARATFERSGALGEGEIERLRREVARSTSSEPRP